MNKSQTSATGAAITKESKNKIRVDFERTSRWERFKIKFLSLKFVGEVAFKIFRLILLIGVSYIVLFPFLAKIAGSFMDPRDFLDSTVKMVPKYPTLNTYRAIIIEGEYFKAMFNTAMLSVFCGVLQTMMCTLIGYGFSKFKFKGRGILFLCVIFTMVVPHETLMLSLFMKFRYFDIFGIYSFIRGLMGFTKASDLAINLTNTFWPLGIMSFCGLAFKNGLYIFMMRQFFKGVPDELEEAAYVDGAGVLKTYVQIILPLSIPMMVTIFMFAFSWQWTDDFYSTLFYTEAGMYQLVNIVQIPRSLTLTPEAIAASNMYNSAIRNTCGLMILLPLLVIYMFAQRTLIQGIERSGIVG